jgi:hypothetical protein
VRSREAVREKEKDFPRFCLQSKAALVLSWRGNEKSPFQNKKAVPSPLERVINQWRNSTYEVSSYWGQVKMTSRKIKIEIAGDFFRRKTHPKIRSQRQWLAKLGFAPGSRVAVIPMTAGEITLKIERPTP